MKRLTNARGVCFTTLLGAAAFWAALAGCSPALNWRTVAVPEAGLQIALPCKPETATRTVELAGAPQGLSMLGCEADGATLARLGAVPASPGVSLANGSTSDARAASAPVAGEAAGGGAGNPSSQPF